MLSRVAAFFLLLILAILTVGCSAKPSKEEFDNLVRDRIIQENTNSLNKALGNGNKIVNLENDKTIWLVAKGWPIEQEGIMICFIGTKIIKNDKKESVKNYPYIGKGYYIKVVTFKGAEFYKESVRKSIVNEAGKLKVKDLREKVNGVVKLAGYSAEVHELTYKWSRTTHKWQ